MGVLFPPAPVCQGLGVDPREQSWGPRKHTPTPHFIGKGLGACRHLRLHCGGHLREDRADITSLLWEENTSSEGMSSQSSLTDPD